MGNNWFRFKEFVVNQGESAMKVSTDGILLGAWANSDACKNPDSRILDIGTGTGLLSLMLAQRYKSMIDAVEIDEAAANQARENFQGSIWKERLQVTRADIRVFCKQVQNSYDHIICNPPYFSNSLKSPNEKRTTARHDTSLTFEDLAFVASELLKEEGALSLIIPPARLDDVGEAFNRVGFFPSRYTGVRTSAKGSLKRSLCEFKKTESTLKTSELCIYQDNQKDFSEDFVKLTRDFYLHL